MALSVLTALIFTPSLCATLLRPRQPGEEDAQRRGFFGLFNAGFARLNGSYERAVGHVTASTGRYLLIYVAIVAVMALLFVRVPTAFLPDEDQGIMFLQVVGPPGTPSEITQATLNQVRDYFLNDEKKIVSAIFTVNGFSFGGHGQSSGLGFVRLKDWRERPGADDSVFALAKRANMHFHRIRGGIVVGFAPPPALELGNATGFDFELEDLGNVGHDKLMQAGAQLADIAGKDPAIGLVRLNGLPDEPQYKLDIDWEKASALGLSIADISSTLGAGWGSAYVNQFIDRGRVKRVFIQGDPSSRMLPQDLGQWYVRNATGQMVPFSAFATANWTYGSPQLKRYNGLPALEYLGEPTPGRSTGDALAAMESAVSKLPKGIGYEWTGLSYEEKKSGAEAPALYAISIVVVFLCLAALYESWSIPFAVMLVVPLGIIGTVAATLSRGLGNDVFFQVGLLTTVGLSAKNAILIVEFAKANYESGMQLIEATVAAAHQRLRPILMTSLAFMLGVFPLAVATGAGAGGRIAIGTGVFGGMFTATVLALILVPVFFVWVVSFSQRRTMQVTKIERAAPQEGRQYPRPSPRPVPGE
jgi:multidrug efflux pump